MTPDPKETAVIQSIPALEVRPGDLLMPGRREVVAVEIDQDPRVVVLKYVTKGAPIYAGTGSTQDVLR